MEVGTEGQMKMAWGWGGIAACGYCAITVGLV